MFLDLIFLIFNETFICEIAFESLQFFKASIIPNRNHYLYKIINITVRYLVA